MSLSHMNMVVDGMIHSKRHMSFVRGPTSIMNRISTASNLLLLPRIHLMTWILMTTMMTICSNRGLTWLANFLVRMVLHVWKIRICLGVEIWIVLTTGLHILVSLPTFELISWGR
ncbi:hypothetical protein Egran_00128 [Elaphomyces granulatus]|uniref:Uncharacterized protein n=1 Tax=Elaphomyces granulatus TaxID=519963 RepID=A0A232M6T7_9EURO|nr:hypothetical protein Egran_00128 [Elaphomyces granulatus]